MPDEEPDEEHIRLRAYYLWLQAGGHHGADIDHWLAAETHHKAAPPSPENEIPLEIKYQDPA